mmetsp:Transcript_10555/g.21386  ORF Transcript_10555/g.21386 Transcript_10555/m.21386 type:complete len:250 (+) Transcript_10555:16-765(+)
MHHILLFESKLSPPQTQPVGVPSPPPSNVSKGGNEPPCEDAEDGHDLEDGVEAGAHEGLVKERTADGGGGEGAEEHGEDPGPDLGTEQLAAGSGCHGEVAAEAQEEDHGGRGEKAAGADGEPVPHHGNSLRDGEDGEELPEAELVLQDAPARPTHAVGNASDAPHHGEVSVGLESGELVAVHLVDGGGVETGGGAQHDAAPEEQEGLGEDGRTEGGVLADPRLGSSLLGRHGRLRQPRELEHRSADQLH